MRYLKSIFTVQLLLLGFFLATHSNHTHAQSTIFSIPSTDVVAKKSVYLEIDFLAHLESYDKGGFQSYVPRIVVGLGKKFEAGMNVSFTKTASLQPVELQPNVKYKFYEGEKNGVSAAAGTLFYIPITKRAGTDTFSMIYSNVSKQVSGKYGPRFTGGAYTLVGRSKGTGTRTGALAAYEQPLGTKVKFVTDWFSGKNRFGYISPGFSITTSKTSSINLIYTIGNEGRKNNAMYIYYGITF